LGDVVISIDTARRQAAERAASLGSELDRLLIHGVLHLLGYDHERAPAEGVVVAVAETPRRRFGVPLAVLSGLCLAAAFPSLEVAPLAWVGLVPLLLAMRGRSPGASFGLGWITGTVFYLVTCYWIVYTIGHYTALSVPLGGLRLLRVWARAGVRTR